MRSSVRRAAGIGLAALALAWPLAAAAQVQRTFVASSGVDTDPCTFAQPCRSFVAAIAQTATGAGSLPSTRQAIAP